jgi:hypothetical protein
MLPLLYMFKKDRVYSEYEHHLFSRAFSDLDAQGRDGAVVRNEMIKAAAEAYYEGVGVGGNVFLDKTPRYTIICNELAEVFPDAIFLVLLRHPLACVKSMCETFQNGRWCMHRFDIDLIQGLDQLCEFIENEKYSDRTIVFEYSSFTRDPESHYKSICKKLDLDPADCTEFDQNFLSGSLGDPVGGKRYGANVNRRDHDARWACAFNTIYRRLWARRLLLRMGHERLSTLGIDLDETLALLKTSRYSLLREICDLPWVLLSFMHRFTGLYVTLDRWRHIFRREHYFGVR